MDKLPVFEMIIDPQETSDVEVSFVALVDKPAIERNFLAFNSKQLDFAINEDQRIISGPAMVADSLIYRRDDNGEYNVFFSKPTIKEIELKFFKKGYNKNLNLFHDASLPADGATIFESFVSDKERGIQPMKGFEDLPDGSWFVSVKIENEEIWNKIKSGEVKGFSVEGIFSYVKKQSGTHASNYHLVENSFMSEVKDLLKTLKEKFLGGAPAAPAAPVTPQSLGTEYTLKDGTVVSVDRLEVGGIVMVGDVPAPAGVHELADGTKVTVGDGGVIQAVEMMNQVDPYASQFAAIEEKFGAYELRFAEQQNTIQTLSESFNQQTETIKGLVEIVEKLSDTPTADPVQKPTNGFSSQKVKNKDEKLNELASLIKNLKSK